MQQLSHYTKILEDYLAAQTQVKEPAQLYTPISYIVSLGGKRLRPVLTLMSGEFFGASTKDSLNAALAVELFHNFSLIHDDIMDNAPLRRGKPTVHEKWNVNIGILSGDALLIMAYQLFENYPPDLFQELAKLFSKTAIEVCEGQQYDIDFETRDDVTVQEYLHMINYKTAVLVGASLKMGAVVAHASEASKDGIYEFGRKLGIAFQLQDDYLDAFGDPERFRKQVGGDIISNKKTYLYLAALELGAASEKKELLGWFNSNSNNSEEKVKAVKQLFESTGASKAIQNKIESYTNDAFAVLSEIDLPMDKKEKLKQFGVWLMNRKV